MAKKKYAKPWTEYRLALAQALEVLLAEWHELPLTPPARVQEWIAELTYVELWEADEECKHIVSMLPLQPEDPSALRQADNIRVQVVLRIECALDLCRGIVGKRKQFDWDRPSRDVYRDLLIERWRNDAMYWAHQRRNTLWPLSLVR